MTPCIQNILISLVPSYGDKKIQNFCNLRKYQICTEPLNAGADA